MVVVFPLVGREHVVLTHTRGRAFRGVFGILEYRRVIGKSRYGCCLN